MIINKGRDTVIEASKLVGIELPERFKTIYLPEENINALKPEMPAILTYCDKSLKRTYMPKIGWFQSLKLINNKRDILIVFNDEDYIFLNGKELVDIKGPMAQQLYNMTAPASNPVEAELKQFGPLKTMKGLYKDKTYNRFVEFVFENLDTNIEIIYEIMYKPTTETVWLFKLLYVLQFINSQDLGFLRTAFEGNGWQGEMKEEAEDFIITLNRFTNLNIDLDLIYRDIEEKHFDDEYIDYVDNAR